MLIGLLVYVAADVLVGCTSKLVKPLGSRDLWPRGRGYHAAGLGDDRPTYNPVLSMCCLELVQLLSGIDIHMDYFISSGIIPVLIIITM